MSSAGAVVQRYAQAIFELGLESQELGAISDQIRAMADAWSSSRELRLALEDPVLEETRRQALLAEVAQRLGIHGAALNALRVMAERRRLSALPEVARELTRLTDEHNGVLRASVTSAAPLPESYFQSLTQKLEASTHKKIVLERQEDPSLIGGIVLRIGDSIIDGSIRGRLDQLERRLLASSTTAQA
jgi:F-type H+-transporting ATPase subunit delta